MKKLTYIISASILLLTLGLLGCKDDDPGVEEVEKDKISKTWDITNDGKSFVLLDNMDVTSSFNEFVLTVQSDGTYLTAGGEEPNLWPASGSWAFERVDGTINFSRVIREDGLILEIEKIDGDNLKFSFQFQNDVHSGKMDGVSAQYTFNLYSR